MFASERCRLIICPFIHCKLKIEKCKLQIANLIYITRLVQGQFAIFIFQSSSS